MMVILILSAKSESSYDHCNENNNMKWVKCRYSHGMAEGSSQVCYE